MSEKRSKTDSLPQSPMKIEIKEENLLGNDYLVARGRLQGVLKQLTEQSESETEEESSDDHYNYRNKKRSYDGRKRNEVSAAPVRSTYLMKLYDRSVDLAKFEENTPLYPICRAWMANNNNNNKKQNAIVKRRLSSPEPDIPWTNNNESLTDVYRLPQPRTPFTSRVPSPLPEQLHKDLDGIDPAVDAKPPVSKSDLMEEHTKRWQAIKQKWIATAAKNEERYAISKQVLQSIYNKAQEGMMTE